MTDVERELSDLELLVYRELGDFLDRYARHLLHGREHQLMAIRIAKAMRSLRS